MPGLVPGIHIRESPPAAYFEGAGRVDGRNTPGLVPGASHDVVGTGFEITRICETGH